MSDSNLVKFNLVLGTAIVFTGEVGDDLAQYNDIKQYVECEHIDTGLIKLSLDDLEAADPYVKEAAGLATYFMSGRVDNGIRINGGFDESGYIELLEFIDGNTHPIEAVTGWLENFSSWDASNFVDAYVGSYESQTGCDDRDTLSLYAESRDIDSIPDNLKQHIDWESYSRDFCHDYWTAESHVFLNT